MKTERGHVHTLLEPRSCPSADARPPSFKAAGAPSMHFAYLPGGVSCGLSDESSALRQGELERAARINLLGQMAAGLAHEVNQPLAALIYTLSGAVNRARDGALNNAQMLEALQASVAHAHRSAAIVNRIREMATRHTPRRTEVQLNEVAAEMVELCALNPAHRCVRLTCEPDPRLPPLQVDKVQIEQVLLNLLGNGIDAVLNLPLARQQVVLRTAVLDEATIEVSVTDSGAGLASERIARMFEPFYTTKENGMGLGLAICQSIVEEHGGSLYAENQRQGGMRVGFTLQTGAAGDRPALR